jgi:hypothetical protein
MFKWFPAHLSPATITIPNLIGAVAFSGAGLVVLITMDPRATTNLHRSTIGRADIENEPLFVTGAVSQSTSYDRLPGGTRILPLDPFFIGGPGWRWNAGIVKQAHESCKPGGAMWIRLNTPRHNGRARELASSA